MENCFSAVIGSVEVSSAFEDEEDHVFGEGIARGVVEYGGSFVVHRVQIAAFIQQVLDEIVEVLLFQGRAVGQDQVQEGGPFFVQERSSAQQVQQEITYWSARRTTLIIFNRLID